MRNSKTKTIILKKISDGTKLSSSTGTALDKTTVDKKGKVIFYIFLSLFAAQAAWVAISTSYPLPMDEGYHFEMTRIYTSQVLPFISEQTIDSASLGDVTRLSSYLYHYLLSFPLRAIELVAQDMHAQIVSLRFINILIVVVGLIVLKNILIRQGIRFAYVNSVIATYMLIATTTFLAATINYDNLFFLGLMLYLYVGQSLVHQYKKVGRIPVDKLLLFLSMGMLTSLVKYAFLPIFLVGGLTVLIALIILRRNLKQVLLENVKIVSSLGLLVILLATISTGLFLERYGVNMVAYGSPAPDCAKVQSVNHCAQYAPWQRNYALKEAVSNGGNPPSLNPASFFTSQWMPMMLNGLGAVQKTNGFEPRLLIIYITTVKAIIVISVIACIVLLPWLYKDTYWRILGLTIMFYTLVLFATNFNEYRQTGEPVAVQTRYLLVFIPFLLAVSYQAILNMLHYKRTNMVLAVSVCLLLLQGGGITSYMVLSDGDWYWEYKGIADLNNNASQLVDKLVYVQRLNQ